MAEGLAKYTYSVFCSSLMISTITLFQGAPSIIVIIVGNGFSDLNSNPRQYCFYFTKQTASSKSLLPLLTCHKKSNEIVIAKELSPTI